MAEIGAAEAEPARTSALQRLIDNRLIVAAGLFAAALVFFISFEARHIARSGYWTDELFSLWAGDPRVPFGQAFMERILGDTNAPTYFSLVHLVRHFVYGGRTAFVIINFTGLALILGLMIWRGFQREMPVTALLVAAFFLVGCPALAYGPEGRAYVLGMATCVALAFTSGILVAGNHTTKADFIAAAGLAVLATWLHVYGAIFAGSLGVALIVSGFFAGRHVRLMQMGFVIGAAATAAFAIWIAFAYPMFSKTVNQGFWLPFTPASVKETFWMAKEYTIGWTLAAPIGAGFIAASLWPAHSRAQAIVAIVAGALFIAIPLLASFHTVIIHGRYFLIGTPALLVLTALVFRSHIIALLLNENAAWAKPLAAIGALFLLSPILTGAPTAAWHFRERWDWRGIDAIAPLAAQCTDKDIRVLNSSIRNLSGFEYLLEGKLTPIDATKAPTRDVSEIACPVYGWAEHYLALTDDSGWAARAGVAEALASFHLTNKTGVALAIDRHPGGLVLRRADVTTPKRERD
jgi:hypothetical protein